MTTSDESRARNGVTRICRPIHKLAPDRLCSSRRLIARLDQPSPTSATQRQATHRSHTLHPGSPSTTSDNEQHHESQPGYRRAIPNSKKASRLQWKGMPLHRPSRARLLDTRSGSSSGHRFNQQSPASALTDVPFARLIALRRHRRRRTSLLSLSL